MIRVFHSNSGRRLNLAGRTATEIVSARAGAQSTTLRMVEIPVPCAGEPVRGPHVHVDFEECIVVLSGLGVTEADSGRFPLERGDCVLIPPGEAHVTRNVGDEPLVLLCFFPVSDIGTGTRELPPTIDTR
jgi:mannose-6-phosphate isomerase-like protein (cupin superfamily)